MTMLHLYFRETLFFPKMLHSHSTFVKKSAINQNYDFIQLFYSLTPFFISKCMPFVQILDFECRFKR